MSSSRIIFAALLTVVSAPALAAPATANKDYLGVSVGQAGIFDDADSTAFGAEYRYKDVGYGIRPTIGYLGDDDGAAYGYVGADWDFPVTDSFYIIPSLGVGAYHHGDSQDLGGGLEFRTAVEGAYEFDSGHRLGLELSHLSNAGIHNKNPGTEVLQVTYALPIGWAD